MYSHENGKMRPVETIPQMGNGGGVRIMMEGVNLTFLRTFVNVTMSAQDTPILYIYIYIYIIYHFKTRNRSSWGPWG
jgi:hypothetical protein